MISLLNYRKVSLKPLLCQLIIFIIILLFTGHSIFAYDSKEIKSDKSAIGDDIVSPAKIKYDKIRNQLIKSDEVLDFDRNITLNDQEIKANNNIINLRNSINKDLKEKNIDIFSTPFYKNKVYIESTELYKILKEMPKGAVLHVHRSASGNSDWVVKNITYRPDCYICWNNNDSCIKGQISFFKPGSEPDGYLPVSKLRTEIPDFDNELYKLITLGVEDEMTPDIWQEFINCFIRIGKMLKNKPVYTDYLTNSFNLLVDDGVQYIEIRSGLGDLYDLEGNKYNSEDIIKMLLAIRDQIRIKHPEFDLKLVYSGDRTDSKEDVKKDLEKAKMLKEKYPDFIVGFDLVGYEDEGNTTYYYIDTFLDNPDMPYYFHDGETKSFENKDMYDAVLLNSKRIGHGLNLFYFPNLEKELIKRDLALEICPISNQALNYIQDFRLHPARGYLQRGVPCVISSDDPAIFQNIGITFDFWVACMAWDLDLKALKQLALNSIKYSSINKVEKQKALEAWETKWNIFIENLAQKNY